MLICSLILLAGYLVWLLGEAYINRRARRSFRHVIHVNGIRGKTTTSGSSTPVCDGWLPCLYENHGD